MTFNYNILTSIGVLNVIDCPAIKSYPFKQSIDSQIFNAIALSLYH